MVSCGLPTFVIIALLALLAALLQQWCGSATPGGVILSDASYDIKPVDAPAATGNMLRILSWLLADSPFGPAMRRFLLNKNGASELRELALQISEAGGPIAYQPMHRLPEYEWRRHADAAAGRGAVESLLQQGTSTDPSVLGGEHFVTVEDYARAYRSGSSTPTAAIERVLLGIRELHRKLQPFVTVLEEEVRSQARESEKRIAAGQPLSIFDGVPIAFKDMIRVRGHPCFEGSAWPEGHARNQASDKDDTIVLQFRRAGAVILGTTAMTEFGVTPLGYSAHHQGPRNAYNSSYYPGGSSSGSAVAVALGLVPVAVGFDGGGSIRIPAALEGVFGLATTYGRIPHESFGSASSTMQKAGPIAASATDAALAYAVMAQTVPSHHFSRLYGEFPGLPPPHLAGFRDTDLRGMRLGVFWDHFNDADPVIVTACLKAIRTLERLGVEVVDVRIPHLRLLSLAHAFAISVEFSSLEGNLLSTGHHLEPSTRVQLALGSAMSGVEVHAANMVRGWATQYLHELFNTSHLSAIVSPACGVLPPRMAPGAEEVGESNTPLIMQMMKYIFLGNLLGFPGLSVPIDYDQATSLPIGMHLLGNHWEDATLLRLAHAMEVHHLQRRKPHSVFEVFDQTASS